MLKLVKFVISVLHSIYYFLELQAEHKTFTQTFRMICKFNQKRIFNAKTLVLKLAVEKLGRFSSRNRTIIIDISIFVRRTKKALHFVGNWLEEFPSSRILNECEVVSFNNFNGKWNKLAFEMDSKKKILSNEFMN